MAYTGLTEEEVRDFQQYTPFLIERFNELRIKEKADQIKARLPTGQLLGPVTSAEKELRLVLCGLAGAEKTALGNLITGRNSFKELCFAEGQPQMINTESCEVDGIHVTVVDIPRLFDPREKPADTLCMINKVLDLFSEGVHGFLCVISGGNPRFTEEERHVFEMLKELLGPRILDHCFVVITHGGWQKGMTLAEYLDQENKTDTPFSNVMREIGSGKVLAVENSDKTVYGRTEQQRQIIRVIASNINGVYTREGSREHTQDAQSARVETYQCLTEEEVQNYRNVIGLSEEQIAKMDNQKMEEIKDQIKRRLPTGKLLGPAASAKKELRLVLCGKTGAGKSALGNLITAKNKFKDSFSSESCTQTIQMESCDVDGIHVEVIDTPGLFDPKKKAEVTLCEIAKVFDRFSGGVHGFLFVFNAGNPRFTEEDRQVFEKIKADLLGPTFLNYCFVVITNGNNLKDMTLKKYLENEGSSDFCKLLVTIGKEKVMAVENMERTAYGRMEQQRQIIRMVASNVEGVYTNQAHSKYQKERQNTVRRLDADVRSLAPDIEDALSDELDRRAWHDIIMMSATTKQAIVERVFVKVRPKASPGVGIGKLRESILIVLNDKIWRLTAKVMLGTVAGTTLVISGIGLIAAVGPQIVAFVAALAEYEPGLAILLPFLSLVARGKP